MMFETEFLLRFLFFVSGITLLFLTFKFKLERDTKKAKKNNESIYECEQEASFARKKAIPESLFIYVDFDTIPRVSDKECMTCYEKIISCSDVKMANLKGITNLELKQSYGAAHFELLLNYENNYQSFIDILVKYGTILYEKDFIDDAQSVLEAAVNYQCDLSKCYSTLSAVYVKKKDKVMLDKLQEAAKQNMAESYYLTKVCELLQNAQKDIE